MSNATPWIPTIDIRRCDARRPASSRPNALAGALAQAAGPSGEPDGRLPEPRRDVRGIAPDHSALLELGDARDEVPDRHERDRQGASVADEHGPAAEQRPRRRRRRGGQGRSPDDADGHAVPPGDRTEPGRASQRDALAARGAALPRAPARNQARMHADRPDHSGPALVARRHRAPDPDQRGSFREVVQAAHYPRRRRLVASGAVDRGVGAHSAHDAPLGGREPAEEVRGRLAMRDRADQGERADDAAHGREHERGQHSVDAAGARPAAARA